MRRRLDELEPRLRPARAALGLALSAAACNTAGSRWMAEPLPNENLAAELSAEPPPGSEPPPRPGERRGVRVIGGEPAPDDGRVASTAASSDSAPGAGTPRELAGRSLGTFRNTYYDFPNEAEFDGPDVALKNAKCETIEAVPRGFFESVCVQGSGTLKGGRTVSFSRRDCACAEVCPRSGQRICFDVLDPALFPWGRGAMGKPITPLVSIAVDSDVIPLGTPVYIPELEGLPRDAAGEDRHDGCFIAQDRGVRVKGKHVDVFTGLRAVTAVWNKLVPSNRGVTVVLDSPRCRRAPDSAVPNARQ